ncbi:MAG: TldD/PmbA family protein [Myxococcota bacterium]|nr:TldD/PmbA family protein [Myxococcota bacterium]
MNPKWHQEALASTIQRALAQKTADHATISVRGFEQGATRFANGEINQNVATSDLVLHAAVAFDRRTGTASTNDLSDDAVAACVKKAEEMARLSPPDPEFMPPVQPMSLPEVLTWVETSANVSPAARAALISRAAAVASDRGLSAAGSLTTTARITAIGNSNGHFALNRSTSARFKYSATSSDSVGWASGIARDIEKMDWEGIASRAVKKCEQGRSPKTLSPGRYEVILEPAAVTGLIAHFLHYQFDAKATFEGRTFLSGKEDASLFAPNVHLFSDPTWHACPVCPFDSDGMKLGTVDWIRAGKVANLATTRYWAKREKRSFTGRPYTPILKGGTATIDDMIRSTKRGLWITRLWYIRSVDPMRDLMTGMTRDGTFLIENGEIVGPVRNLRFNDSAARLLNHVELLGETHTTSSWYGPAVAPFLKAREFNFTGKTEF